MAEALLNPDEIKRPGRRYALIAGASVGLGAAFVRACMARGCDLALVARRTEGIYGARKPCSRRRGMAFLGLTLMLLLGLPGAEAASAQGNAIGDLRGHGGAVRSMAVLPGGLLATGGFDSAIIVWDLSKGSASRVLRLHDSTVNALTGLDKDCFASGGEDGRIGVWCGTNTKPERVLTGHTAPVATLYFLKRQRLLASGSWDRSIRLWNVDDGSQVGLIEGHEGPVTGIAALSDGTLVSAGYDGQIRVHGAGAAGASAQLATPLNAVAVAADDAIVTAGGDGVVRFYDRALRPLGEIELNNGPLQALSLSPDGGMIAVAGIRTQITLISRRGLKVTGEILGPGLPVWTLGYSEDGAELYSGGADRALRRWDPKTAAPAGRDLARAEALPRIPESEEGARVFRACRACHSLEAGDNSRAGPSLHGVMGRRVATAPGYAYSDALGQLSIVWDKETIARLFEVGPNAYLPGTKMPEQRISDPSARRALVDWLEKATR